MRIFAAVCLFLFLPMQAWAQADGGSTQKFEIPIRDMMDLNFKSKQDIYALRTKFVDEHPEFVDKGYKPSDAVFGQIQDGKPWWGILGRSFYGPGEHAIDGPAEESRFIANPLLLIGLDNGHALVSKLISLFDSTAKPFPLYPHPSHLYWRGDREEAGVTYDMATFWLDSNKAHDPMNPQQNISMIAYNARDMGFTTMYINPELSKNIVGSPDPIPLIQFIHTGGSCGYSGGCNNISPYQKEAIFHINQLPAVAYIKLWKSPPANAYAPADMVFIIKMI